jgi:hypothetical protein
VSTTTTSSPGASAATPANPATTANTQGSKAATGTPNSEGVLKAKRLLTAVASVAPEEIVMADEAPNAPGADAVLRWGSGRAEIDSGVGRIYFVSVASSTADSSVSPLAEDRLRLEAVAKMHALGWTDGTLQGLGFVEEQPGRLDEQSGLYTLGWRQKQLDPKSSYSAVDISVDGRTAALVHFSAWIGSNALDIAGAISEPQALQIAQTEIYLESDSKKLTLAGDGSLILLSRAVNEELKYVKDKTYTRNKQVLCWVITVLGRVGQQLMGGTVYVDAKTGKVLHYQPYEPPKTEPTETTELTEPR